jgi:hypothetical protein
MNTETPQKKFTIHNVWQQVDPILADEIATLWLDQKALPDRRQAIDRSQQVVFIARDEDGKIAGISTAYKQLNPQIEHYFYYMRAFVHPDYRQLGLVKKLSLAVIAFFEMRFHQGLDEEVVGVFSILENKNVQQHVRDAVVLPGGYVYIGKNERGHHQRVRYFEGAKI